VANQRLTCPGFTQVVSWRDSSDDTYTTCALLVSNATGT
jgi:hypothetical protein